MTGCFRRLCVPFAALLLAAVPAAAQSTRTQKPPLHAQEWMAVIGKPLGAAAPHHRIDHRALVLERAIQVARCRRSEIGDFPLNPHRRERGLKEASDLLIQFRD